MRLKQSQEENKGEEDFDASLIDTKERDEMTSEWYTEFTDGDDDDDEIEETMEKLPHLN